MKKVNIGIFLFALLMAACMQPTGNQSSADLVAKGGKQYGGKFRFNERTALQTLFPYQISDAVSLRIGTQVYEGLVKFNSKDLSIMPAIAESWEVNDAGTVYTFHLKKGVMFHDDSCFPEGRGRELTANDIKYSFEMLCSDKFNDTTQNVMFTRTLDGVVLGAHQYYEATKKGTPEQGLQGLNVVDDYTVTIELESPSSSFMYTLCTPATYIVAKEAMDKYGEDLVVGSGPFVFNGWVDEVDMMGQHQEKLILTRNAVYHGTDSVGNQLPFLDTLEVSFINSQKKELEMFQQKEIEMVVGLPAESVRDVVEQKIAYFEQDPPIFILERVADMSTSFYVFNLHKDVFSDELEGKKVRQAISYAINREKIIDKMLSGEAEGPGIHGVTPSSLIGYDISKISGYGYDPKKAKELLADAGYADGKGFPTLTLKINDDAKNTRVAIEVQKQLKTVLNINLELAILPLHELIKAQQMADGDIFRSGWIADYPNPESFLQLFYGKSVPSDMSQPSLQNVSRYVNTAFDELYEKGLNADSLEEKYGYYAEAEQLMINDAPIIVMWYDEQYRMIQSNVHDVMLNPMLYRDFSAVYMQEPKAKPQKTAAPVEAEEASAEE